MIRGTLSVVFASDERTFLLKRKIKGTHSPMDLALSVSERNHSCQWRLRRGRQLCACNGMLRTEVNQRSNSTAS